MQSDYFENKALMGETRPNEIFGRAKFCQPEGEGKPDETGKRLFDSGPPRPGWNPRLVRVAFDGFVGLILFRRNLEHFLRNEASVVGVVETWPSKLSWEEQGIAKIFECGRNLSDRFDFLVLGKTGFELSSVIHVPTVGHKLDD